MLNLTEPNLFALVATAALFVAGSLAMQSVLLWRWQRRLDAGLYDAGLARAGAAAAPQVVAAMVDAVADTLAERVKMGLLGLRGGVASGESRRAAKLDADLAEAYLGGAGVDLSDLAKEVDPALGKFFKKNPAVAQAVAGFVEAKVRARLGGNGAGSAEVVTLIEE